MKNLHGTPVSHLLNLSPCVLSDSYMSIAACLKKKLCINILTLWAYQVVYNFALLLFAGHQCPMNIWPFSHADTPYSSVRVIVKLDHQQRNDRNCEKTVKLEI